MSRPKACDCEARRTGQTNLAASHHARSLCEVEYEGIPASEHDTNGGEGTLPAPAGAAAAALGFSAASGVGVSSSPPALAISATATRPAMVPVSPSHNSRGRCRGGRSGGAGGESRVTRPQGRLAAAGREGGSQGGTARGSASATWCPGAGMCQCQRQPRPRGWTRRGSESPQHTPDRSGLGTRRPHVWCDSGPPPLPLPLLLPCPGRPSCQRRRSAVCAYRLPYPKTKLGFSGHRLPTPASFDTGSSIRSSTIFGSCLVSIFLKKKNGLYSTFVC